MFGPGRLKIIKLSSGFQILCEIEGIGSSYNYLTQAVFRVNNKLISEMLLGSGLSNHMVIGTEIKNLTQGDRVTVQWQDLRGNNGEASEVFEK